MKQEKKPSFRFDIINIGLNAHREKTRISYVRCLAILDNSCSIPSDQWQVSNIDLALSYNARIYLVTNLFMTSILIIDKWDIWSIHGCFNNQNKVRIEIKYKKLILNYWNKIG